MSSNVISFAKREEAPEVRSKRYVYLCLHCGSRVFKIVHYPDDDEHAVECANCEKHMQNLQLIDDGSS